MPSFGPDQDPARATPSSRRARAREPVGERLAGDPLVGLLVERARALDDVVGQRRRGRRLVPARPRRPVAHVLLVERRLAAAGLVGVGRPEARRVRRQHLVADDDPAVGGAAELELRVGQDDPALARVVGGERVELDRQAAQLLEQRPVAEDLGGAVEVDVLVVVAHLGLRGGREDRLGQLVRLAQALGQRDPADLAGALVVLPARARDVAAHDALDREHLELLDEQGAALAPRRGRPCRRRRGSGRCAPVRSNQKTDTPVSTAPLPGIGVGWIAS